MRHRTRAWNPHPVESAEVLAKKLTDVTWTGCTAFELGDYLFLNDATCGDGAQEFAVVKRLPDGSFEQLESITFSWCTYEKALELIRQTLAGEFDQVDWRKAVTPRLETSAEHGRCYLCA